jgi:hypothetical protein
VAAVGMVVGFDQTGAGGYPLCKFKPRRAQPHSFPKEPWNPAVAVSFRRINNMIKPGSVASNPRVDIGKINELFWHVLTL